MALGDPYVSATQLKAYLGIADTADDTRITDACASISRDIENYCQGHRERQFNDAGSASTREFEPCGGLWLEVDDFSTLTGLVVKYDSAGDGTFATTISATNYKAYPLNGRLNAQTWAFYKIKAINHTWATSQLYQVTARWGWSAVPAPVYEAAKILGNETFGLQGARFGVAGYDQFGPIRVRDSPMAKSKLNPYRREAVLVR